MKKTYQTPTLKVWEIACSQPLLSSNGGAPTIGNSYDESGAQDQFASEKDWSNHWSEE